MRFSERFGVERADEEGWFDPVLTGDTPLYVDPFLLFAEDDEPWAGSRQRVIEFFALCWNA